ncbi:TNT domain-containing protein [Streptosporangium subroseum]|uniref:TNT domain-containing protein n=1 Tax=Streptosporangium subroseum TaxID=106412 RepID=UPI003086618D|nr:TNT domain-containing protein [Streptosporangium subroseum]
MAGTMGGVAAHADSAAQSNTRLIQPTALRPTSSPDKGETEKGSTPTGGMVCGPPYVTGDSDLGPTFLPQTGYLSALLRGYVPLGGLSSQHFLSRYWDYIVNNYRFPPDSGFGRSGNYPNGRLLIKTTFLQIGMKLDRFGGYGGAFMSPMGDLYILRALPPRNLNSNPQDPEHLCNYHAFRVLKSFRVEVGPAAPAFQQPGGGTQYHVLSKYIPEAPQTSEEVPVSWLLQNGYLEEIEPVFLPAPKTDRDTDDRDTNASSTNNHGTSNNGTYVKPRKRQLHQHRGS